jgi:hypothetical protein
MVIMVSFDVSSRFEKVEQPSTREDIDYNDRGQLKLGIFSCKFGQFIWNSFGIHLEFIVRCYYKKQGEAKKRRER